jgi:hypothetical protein
LVDLIELVELIELIRTSPKTNKIKKKSKSLELRVGIHQKCLANRTPPGQVPNPLAGATARIPKHQKTQNKKIELSLIKSNQVEVKRFKSIQPIQLISLGILNWLI